MQHPRCSSSRLPLRATYAYVYNTRIPSARVCQRLIGTHPTRARSSGVHPRLFSVYLKKKTQTHTHTHRHFVGSRYVLFVFLRFIIITGCFLNLFFSHYHILLLCPTLILFAINTYTYVYVYKYMLFLRYFFTKNDSTLKIVHSFEFLLYGSLLFFIYDTVITHNL